MFQLKNVDYVVTDEKTGTKKEILKDLNLSFDKGKITVVTGHNGSGKSTLIKLLMGIEKPTNGQIWFDDKDITDLAVNERANLGISIAFQQPVRFKGLTVKDLLDIANERSTNISDACDFLSHVGLCAREYLDRELDNTLSGGEIKRIELALALAKGGEVFLFDEPEAGIDLWSFDDLIGIFKKLKDKTIIIVSHQKKILEIADKVLLMSNQDYQLGDKEEMLGNMTPSKCARLEVRDE